MNRTSLFALAAVGLLANSLGCELITQVDRCEIPGSCADGLGGAPTTTSSTISSSSSSSAGGSGGSGGSTCVPVDDKNPCTNDVCENGVPAHPPTAAGSDCSTGGTLCDGKGACVACLAPSDCPGADDACQTRTCVQGTCGHDFTAAGTALPIQTTGDCKQDVCDGKGATLPQNLDTDVHDDMNACTDDLCMAGVPSNPPKTQGTSCGGALVCDATGTCVGCIAATDCPGADDECKTRTCMAGVCGAAFTAANTPVAAQTAKNCLKATCDGSGSIANIADNTDLPADDGNACTDEACNAGVPSHPAKANGFICTDGNACTVADTCQAGVCTSGAPVTCAALDQCHAVGTCDMTTGACSNPSKADGSACADGNACTQTDTCQAGACTGANPVTCAALDQCHAAGTCDMTTGACSNPNKADGSACADGNACTQTDTCQAGTCTGTNPVTCAAPDQCHTAGTCDTTTGVCSNPNKADGSACSDGIGCTQTDTCQAGTCTGGSPVVCGAHATCTNTPGSFSCVCDAGYTGDGVTCTPAAAVCPCDFGSGWTADYCSEFDIGTSEEQVNLSDVTGNNQYLLELSASGTSCFGFANGNFSSGSNLSAGQIQACQAKLIALDTANLCGQCVGLNCASKNCVFNPSGNQGGTKCN
jgi:EGF domain